jgi:hypothetical protein
MEKSNFEIWLAVNDDGESAVSMSGASQAREALVDDCGGATIRTVKLTVTMARPEITAVGVDVPSEAGAVEVVSA